MNQILQARLSGYYREATIESVLLVSPGSKVMMSKGKKEKAGGRPTRQAQLRKLAKHIERIRSGAYLQEQLHEYWRLDLEEALSEAADRLGPGGRQMVKSMLAGIGAAANPEAKRDGLRDLLRSAGVKPSTIERIVASQPHVTAAPETESMRKPSESGSESDPLQRLMAEIDAS